MKPVHIDSARKNGRRPDELDKLMQTVTQLLARGMRTSEIAKYLHLPYAEVAGLAVEIKARYHVNTVEELAGRLTDRRPAVDTDPS